MMTQLSKAWMQAEELQPGLPVFSVRASMEDTACVTKVDGGNFGFGKLTGAFNQIFQLHFFSLCSAALLSVSRAVFPEINRYHGALFHRLTFFNALSI